MSFLRERWEKNWPELYAAARGAFPPFVFARDPAEPADVPVFGYHCIRREAFEEDLRFLRHNGYTTVDADTLLDHLEGRRPCPPRAVVLSFDDGAANLHSHVFPALRAYDATAVAFVAPGFHRREYEAPDTPDRPCTWAELRELHDSGLVDVQSHTWEHRYVPRWPEPVTLTGIEPRFHRYGDRPLPMADDFRVARETLEAELGKEVRHLAFPRNDGTADAVRAGLDCGYQAFWWAVRPTPPDRVAGGVGTHVARISGEFVRRLPGRGRLPLSTILRGRYGAALHALGRRGA